MTLLLIGNKALALLAVIAQIGVLILLAYYWFFRAYALLKKVARYALPISFLVALVATLGSLFYSEVVGYTPCTMCWYQRIFMYPLAILFGLAWYHKNTKFYRYALGLSIPGIVFSGYHYLMQIGVVSGGSCSAVGISASCSSRFVLQFGYISIPMMAFSAFCLITVMMFIQKRYQNE